MPRTICVRIRVFTRFCDFIRGIFIRPISSGTHARPIRDRRGEPTSTAKKKKKRRSAKAPHPCDLLLAHGPCDISRSDRHVPPLVTIRFFVFLTRFPYIYRFHPYKLGRALAIWFLFLYRYPRRYDVPIIITIIIIFIAAADAVVPRNTMVAM